MAELSTRSLDGSRPYKPLDFGNGLLAGSVAPDGRILSLGFYHPLHGQAVLSAREPFPDELRYDPGAVRRYRAELASPDAPGFGLSPAQPWRQAAAGLLEDSLPLSRLDSGEVHARALTWAPRLEPGLPLAVQEWRIENRGAESQEWEYRWGGLLCLARASLTQLTEGGVIPSPPAALIVDFDGQALVLENPALGAAVAVLGLPPAAPLHRQGTGTVEVVFSGRLRLGPGQAASLRFIFTCGASPAEARLRAEGLDLSQLEEALQAGLASRRALWPGVDGKTLPPARPLAHRALSYALDCCALALDGSLCLLTDHQILPLSWNRDGYYILAALGVLPEPQYLDLARRHLIWLFEQARRPDGYWGRAYLPTGQPKDRAFQLDQQCYPLLEFAQLVSSGLDQGLARKLARSIPRVLEAILSRRHPRLHLFATEETPGDDPLALPYHFSSQVLLWHTLRRLAGLPQGLLPGSFDLESLTASIYRDIWDHLTVEEDGQKLFVYASDLQGRYRLYHDANDLPTVLAPLWGFCSAQDPVWINTLEFAFSPRNRDGYFPGPWGGLGSQHTPGAWPLGDVQEWIYARLIGDHTRADQALARLAAAACWDGALPEARDPASGAVRSRHWFAWPNCALLAALHQRLG